MPELKIRYEGALFHSQTEGDYLEDDTPISNYGLLNISAFNPHKRRKLLIS